METGAGFAYGEVFVARIHGGRRLTDRTRSIRAGRRGRARLEALRLLRATSRGALAGGAVGMAVSIASRLGLPGPDWLPWACVACGALAGAIGAAFGRGVPLPAAALFLDERLSTDERLVTVV